MERTRSRSSSSTPVNQLWYGGRQGYTQHGFPGALGTPTPTALTLETSTQTVVDWTHPGFRKRIQQGEIINSPFKSITNTWSLSPPSAHDHTYRKNTTESCGLHTPAQSHYRHYNSYEVIVQRGPSLTAGLVMSSVTRAQKRQSAIDSAVTAAFANIDTSEMMALATAAEARKSVDSMRAIFWRAYKIFKNVRKLNVNGVLKELSPKEIADRYMEARYALRPLIYDARGIVGALQKRTGYARETFRGSGTESYTASGTTTGHSGRYGVLFDCSKTITYDVSARAGVLCDVEVSEASILGLDQIAETAWELVPFSFIVDWFSNVGDWIAAHTPNVGVRQRASWVTVKENLKVTQTVTNPRSIMSTYGYTTVSLTYPLTVETSEELVLERIVSPALATFPTVELQLDAWKLTDLGIILKNVFR